MRAVRSWLLGMPQFESPAHADDKRDGFRAGTKAGLLEAAEELWLKLDAMPHDQCADAEGSVELVGGDGHRGGAEFAEIDRQLADDLGGIGVQRDAVFGANRGQFGDGLQNARFVLAQHRRDEPRFGAKQIGQLVDADHAVRVDAQSIDMPATALTVRRQAL